MNLRESQVYISSEVHWYGRILSKRKMVGTEGKMTIDAFVDAELRDRWTRQYPELVELWERHQEARQQSKKLYDEIEAQAMEIEMEGTVL
jgi:hypothetical protein